MPNGDSSEWPDWNELLRRGCTCVEPNDLGAAVPKPGITGWGGHGADAYPVHPDPDCPLHGVRAFRAREAGSVELLASEPPKRVAGVRMDGVYRKKEDGSLWVVHTVCEHPTMTLRKIEPRPGLVQPSQTVGGAIGAPIFDDFVELVPADETAS